MSALVVGLPIASAIIRIIGPHIPGAIRAAEVLLGAGTGPTKLDLVVKAAQSWVEALATGGKIPGPAPTDLSYLVAAIEQALQSMKAGGVMAADGVAGKTYKVTFAEVTA